MPEALREKNGVVHRCLVCGTIAEDHYQLARDPKDACAASPRNVYPGEKCWGAGQPSIGNETHAVTPDYDNPIRRDMKFRV